MFDHVVSSGTMLNRNVHLDEVRADWPELCGVIRRLSPRHGHKKPAADGGRADSLLTFSFRGCINAEKY